MSAPSPPDRAEDFFAKLPNRRRSLRRVSDFSFDRRAFSTGARDIIALGFPGIPVGMVIGVVITESGIGDLAGWVGSWVILAGAANLAMLELMAEQTSAAVVLLTVAFINSRHAMYSAALRPSFAGFPRWFRFVGPYFLIDQVFALAASQPVDMPNRERMWNYFGSAITLWVLWVASVTAGLFLGDIIDPDWQLTFAVPLLFAGLMLLSITNRPGIVAAAVGGGVALLTAGFPQGSGVLISIIAGVSASTLAETRWEAAS